MYVSSVCLSACVCVCVCVCMGGGGGEKGVCVVARMHLPHSLTGNLPPNAHNCRVFALVVHCQDDVQGDVGRRLEVGVSHRLIQSSCLRDAFRAYESATVLCDWRFERASYRWSCAGFLSAAFRTLVETLHGLILMT
jgi:hypothetical protein